MAIKSSNQITFTEHKKIIEIKEWYLATSESTGITTETAGWTTDIQTIDYINKYLWNYEEVVYSIGSSDISEPVIIGFYGKGESGKGISNIVNYYQITQNLVAPELPNSNNESSWSDISIVSNLSPINKYLWNYEAIIYTDGTTTMTDPAIIGVYGDSGTDAITFEIYSVHGFMFKEDLKSIELKTAAFEGGEAITGATYIWYYWDSSSNDGAGDYVAIEQEGQIANGSSLTVSDASIYALSSLKCVMTYNNKTYEDYVALARETVIYTSVVKFFDGSNIFSADDLYIIAYVELYQNNNLLETIAAESYCSGVSSVSSSGIVTTDLDGNFSDGDRMYFVYKNDNGLYDITLGEYSSNQWNVIDNKLQYTYTNTFSHIQSNVIVISKESINKSQNIDFAIYKDGIHISNTNAIVIDINDPIISNTEPENPSYGQLWLDTSVVPSVLKIFEQVKGEDVGKWTACTQYNGQAIYTSQPSSYAKGDLWILADGEVCGNFGPGSMLKATTSSNTYNKSHWVDADALTTEIKNNILQTFTFNPGNESNKGLPGLTIGQTDEAFYTNINSTEMGFYDNSSGQHQKVVYIKNNSATIQNTNLKGNTNFYGQMNICNPTTDPEDETDDALFVWEIETNGSLSLAVAN